MSNPQITICDMNSFKTVFETHTINLSTIEEDFWLRFQEL
jgi:hypothetical protein